MNAARLWPLDSGHDGKDLAAGRLETFVAGVACQLEYTFEREETEKTSDRGIKQEEGSGGENVIVLQLKCTACGLCGPAGHLAEWIVAILTMRMC